MLYLVFNNVPRVLSFGKSLRTKFEKRRQKIAEAAQNGKSEKKDAAATKEQVLSGELNAAISAAIHLYANEHHDEESAVLTIEKVSRRYSPWSSKIYSVTNLRR